MKREEEIRKSAFEYIKSDAVKAGDEYTSFGDFINGAKWADANPHWISVEDELPPRWESNPNVSVPVITFGTLGESSIPFVELQRYDFGESKWQYGDATHWMPFQFPKAPSSSEKPNYLKKGGEE